MTLAIEGSSEVITRSDSLRGTLFQSGMELLPTPRSRRINIELQPVRQPETGELHVRVTQAPEVVPLELQKLEVDVESWGRLVDEVSELAAARPGPYTEAEAERLVVNPARGGCFACASPSPRPAPPAAGVEVCTRRRLPALNLPPRTRAPATQAWALAQERLTARSSA